MDKKHDILADIKRVCSDLGRTVKRDEYLQQGKHSRKEIVDEFGGWVLALNAAGLDNKKSRSSLDTKIIKYDKTIRPVSESYYSDIAPYYDKYLTKPKDAITILVCSDLHSVYIDPFCNHVLQDVNKRVQPDIIALNGDVLDFPLISKYSGDPTRVIKIQEEIDFVDKHILRPLRENNQKAQIDWTWGNHERRLYTYLCCNPGLVSLRNLRWGALFNLDELKINLVARHNFVTQTAKKDRDTAKPFKIYGDDALMISHGTRISSFHTKAEAQIVGHSICIITGHTHRPQYVTLTKRKGRYWALSLGMMARYAVGEDYMPDPFIDWGQSFALVHIYKNQALAEHIVFQDNFAARIGRAYGANSPLQ